ncbi:30S ribosomal protein S18 [Patescibacteria group bacterium]|nr:30S ribosomal protein S18 [Patescibacteria group bacterium]
MKKTKKKGRNKFVRLKGRGNDCVYCKTETVPNWRDYEKLREFLSPRCRILAAQTTGVCMKHQRRLAQVIKEARELALLPYTTSKE